MLSDLIKLIQLNSTGDPTAFTEEFRRSRSSEIGRLDGGGIAGVQQSGLSSTGVDENKIN